MTTTCTLDQVLPPVIRCFSPESGPKLTDVLSIILSSFSLFVAIGVAVTSLIFSLLEHRARTRQENDRIEQDKEQNRLREKAQAERVACWLEHHKDYPKYRIHVHNASDQPIWGVRIEHSLGEPKEIYLPVVPPGTRELDINTEGKNPRNQSVPVRFRDNNGLAWERPAGFDGVLRKAPPTLTGQPTIFQTEPPETSDQDTTT